MQRGLAGFAAISTHSIMTESVQDEVKFCKEVDDPRAPEDNPAEQMITCPIIANNDF